MRYDDPTAAEDASWRAEHRERMDDYRDDIAREVAEDPDAGLRGGDEVTDAQDYIARRAAFTAFDPSHPNHQRAVDELTGRRESPVRGAGWGL